MTLTEDHIKKLLELEAKATQSNWREHSSEMREGTIVNLDGKYVCSVGFGNWPQDSNFIAESRNIFRELAEDWLRMKRKEVQK